MFDLAHLWPLPSSSLTFSHFPLFLPSFFLSLICLFLSSDILSSSLQFQVFYVLSLQVCNVKQIRAAVRVPPSVQIPKLHSSCRLAWPPTANQICCTSDLKHSGGVWAAFKFKVWLDFIFILLEFDFFSFPFISCVLYARKKWLYFAFAQENKEAANL